MGENITKFASIPRLPFLKFGTYRKGAFDEKTIDQETFDDILLNFKRFARILKVKLLIGHDDNQKFAGTAGFPNVGIPSKLWQEGERLFAEVKNVPEKIATLVNNKSFGDVSVEARFNTKQYGSLITNIALLGAELPQINDLGDFIALFSKDEKTLQYMDLPLTNDTAAVTTMQSLIDTISPVSINLNEIQLEGNNMPDENKTTVIKEGFTQEQVDSLLEAQKTEFSKKMTSEFDKDKDKFVKDLKASGDEVTKLKAQIKEEADKVADKLIDDHIEAHKNMPGYLPVDVETKKTFFKKVYGKMGSDELVAHLDTEAATLKGSKLAVNLGSQTASKGASDHGDADSLDVAVTKFSKRAIEISDKDKVSLYAGYEKALDEEAFDDKKITNEVLNAIGSYAK